MRIFLGGTCANSTWRKDLISMLDPKIEYFNPVIEGREWTLEDQEIEELEKDECTEMLYVITSDMKGIYSFFEMGLDVAECNKNLVFCFLEEGFDEDMIRSFRAIEKLAKEKFACVEVFHTLEEVSSYFNLYIEGEKEDEFTRIEDPEFWGW